MDPAAIEKELHQLRPQGPSPDLSGRLSRAVTTAGPRRDRRSGLVLGVSGSIAMVAIALAALAYAPFGKGRPGPSPTTPTPPPGLSGEPVSQPHHPTLLLDSRLRASDSPRTEIFFSPSGHPFIMNEFRSQDSFHFQTTDGSPALRLHIPRQEIQIQPAVFY